MEVGTRGNEVDNFAAHRRAIPGPTGDIRGPAGQATHNSCGNPPKVLKQQMKRVLEFAAFFSFAAFQPAGAGRNCVRSTRYVVRRCIVREDA